jgi:hypothetical protein
MKWKIDYATPEGLELLREVMNQFILWHKRDIILTARTPPVETLLRLEGDVEEGEIHDHHLPEMPQSSLPCIEQVHGMPQSSLPHSEHLHDDVAQSSLQADLTHEQQEALRQQEGVRKESEIQKLHPMYIRRPYVPMTDVTSLAKWCAHDQFKPQN